MSAYNKDAKTPEEHLANVEFQFDNVKGYLAMAEDRKDAGGRISARIKAQCMLESLQSAVAAFETEERAARNKEAA